MSFLRKHKIFWASLVIAYIFLVAVYYLTSVGIRPSTLFLQMRRYIPCALTVALSVTAWQQAGLRVKALLPHVLVGILWVLVYPLCYWTTFHSTLTFIDKHFDQSFGAYFFAFSVCLRLLLLRLNKWLDKSGFRYAFALLHIVALLIPLLQLGYFANYKYPITEAASIALLQTNPAEAKEFILLNFGYSGVLAIAVLLCVLYFVFVRLNAIQNIGDYANIDVYFGKKSLACILVVLVATIGYGSKMFKNTGVMETYVFAKEYFDKTNKFKAYHEKNYASLDVAPVTPQFSKPSTIIMVIGESASAYYMSAYSDTPNDNTPWLRSMKHNDNFILFPHAYASWGQTVPALERALTEKNQYNNKEFNQSLTIIDIAKKAGYETYWFSNQGYVSDADTPITLVAKTADHAQWLCEDKALNGKPQYDGDLLNYLKKVDPTKNNFVVLHFMGSHEDCINRYPQAFAKFSKPNEFDMVKNYDDSLAYTDHVLKEIYQYASSNLNLQAMLYFSDHGGDPYRKRHPDQSGFKFLQVPLFVYVSDEYKQLYPEAVAVYKNNKNKFFTNDLLFETMADLLQVKSASIDVENSLLNSKFKYTADTLTTNLGKNKLSEDKEARRSM
ncbi:MAG: phosphoethanolamine transferase [Erysipelotrichaceae bacterium]